VVRQLWQRLSTRQRRVVVVGVLPLLLFLLFLLADLLAPLPMQRFDSAGSTVVVAADGTPLRIFPDERWIWRYKVTPDEVSPRYLQALLGYEDRWFYDHPGINPFALARAAWQDLRSGRIVSGGSTLTMQVARLLDPHSRSIAGKLRQMFRALQLEWHYGKRDILTFYLNHAPFGGTVEGVQAASLTYLGKPANRLSHAEAALLAVLPQSPTRYRPDLHPERAAAARDKVLDRLQSFGLWDARTVAQAKQERVIPYRYEPPFTAPLLARRLHQQQPERALIRSTLDANLQQRLEAYLPGYAAGLGEDNSAAVLVVDNRTLEARAYAGSSDFFDDERYGQVDMVPVIRSPGSTLKPFLYGFALDDGLIHSESLLVDAPTSFGGYRPTNFSGGYSGPVSVAGALQRSLNVPAVDMLDRLGPNNFEARLSNGGLHLEYPGDAKPSLAMILGGVGTSLEALVGAYSSLDRKGMAADVRLLPEQPLHEHRMMSEGAAWIIREILRNASRPGLPGWRWLTPPRREVAWKTGTSYGFRDAWSVGVSDGYTVGVWVGRPDGTPSPGQYGARTAAPLLFAVMEMLPPDRMRQGAVAARPDSVEKKTICWPLGVEPDTQHPELCQVRREAWTLRGVVPPTLPDRLGRESLPPKLTYWVNPDTGRRVTAKCEVEKREEKKLARWPLALLGHLPPHWRKQSVLPPLDPQCRRPGEDSLGPPLHLVGVDPEMKVLPAGPTGEKPLLRFSAVGGEGKLYWLLDGVLEQTTYTPGRFRVRLEDSGEHRLTVRDRNGNYDTVRIMVESTLP